MASYTNKLKVGFTSVFLLLVSVWAFFGAFSTVKGDAVTGSEFAPPEATATPSADYVGSESCQACHEDQFKNFTPTKHARLAEVPGWKHKVVGCESCHGPGKKHIEDATTPGTIISFKKMSAKQVSETCLACHAGKESHNNFRRGEHWRNNVGCNDCHSPHGAPGIMPPGSITFPGQAAKPNSGFATVAMLRQSEPQLCIGCHTETKTQFSKPFHHKVLEGTMKCSDCHNSHGGFESKQVKLAVGADQACIKCHSNRQGPFVFEHAPLKIEGCAVCHIPHGSSNPKMLKRPQVRQLCIECHTGITEELSPQLPSRHNQAMLRERNCTVCHSAIHGSNSSRLFFR